MHRPGSNVDLAAEDRLYLYLLCRLIELNRPEEISVVGESDGRHLKGGRLLDQLLHSDRSIQQRILAMDMEVNERSVSHP